jgi:hypothetical protein
MPASTPPLLPFEVLARVVRLARTDGRLVLWLSGGFALLSAAGHDGIGAAAGVAAAGAGAIEMHGSGLLERGEGRGLDWVIRAQLLLLATILIYSAARLMHFDPELVKPFVTAELAEQIKQLNLTQDQFFRTLNLIIYIVVAFVSLIYQGTMARYYASRRPAIKQALDAEGGRQQA